MAAAKKESSSSKKNKRVSHSCTNVVYNARKVILQQLDEDWKFDVSEYVDFSTNEIDAMIKHSQCDMLLKSKQKMVGGGGGTSSSSSVVVVPEEEEEPSRSVYVLFHNVNGAKSLIKTIRKNVLETYIEDLFHVERVLSKRDTLVVIVDDEPNETIKNYLVELFTKDGIFVIIHNIARLQFNIIKHTLVPKHRILDEEETKRFLDKFHVTDRMVQLPEISRFDPVAQAIGLRPKQVCHIVRKSPTALFSDYFRVCV